MKAKNTKIRTFENGSTRDTAGGKIEYHGFRHPLLEHSFGMYMHGHRLQSNGEMRDSNNWWLGWDKIVSLQSLVRHTADLEALHEGYIVLKERKGDEEITHVVTTIPKHLKHCEVATIEGTLNAIRFGSQSYLLEYLK